MNDRDLITGLDACRSASDDLRQPEFRAVAEEVALGGRAHALRERIERIDAALSRAMQDVSPPQGFADRLVARLHDSAQAATIGVVGAEVSTAVVVPATLSSVTLSSRRQGSRRQWLAWSAGLASAAAAIVAGVIFLRPQNPLYGHDLEASRQWHGELAASDEWRPINQNELDQHQLPTELRYVPTRYQDASSIVGRDARAYDLTPPGGPRATLFVIPQEDRAGLPSSAPTRTSSTQGLGVASWQSGGYIYVVVLQSDSVQDYESLLRTVSRHAA